MFKNKKIIILLLILLIGGVGTTIAYFKNNETIKNTVKSNEYAISYNYDFIKDSTWQPGDIDYPDINVSNDGEIPVIVRAKFIENWIDENGNNIPLTLYNNESVVVKTINTNWFKDGNYYYYYKAIKKDEITSSILDYVIYNSNTDNNMNCTTNSNGTTCGSNNDYANATYKLSISFETIQADAALKEWGIDLTKPKSLNSLITQQAIYDDITSPTVTNNIRINEISSLTNGNGVFIRNDNNYTYYRGNVNNNLIFANHCWKIVSITNKGAIKIIYNGQPNNGICDNNSLSSGIAKTQYNLNSNDIKYNGYMYQTNSVDDTDSNAKRVVDEWYQNNLIPYSSYLVDTEFLAERDGEKGFNFPFAFVGRVRIWGNNNKGHEFNVPNTYIRLGTPYTNDIFTTSTSNGNGKLKYPVGLLTSDEAILAGLRGVINNENTGANPDNYLTCNNTFWLMTPAEYYNTGSTMVYVNPNGSLGGSLSVATEQLIRPVIALRNNINYISGNGTTNNPYIISE